MRIPHFSFGIFQKTKLSKTDALGWVFPSYGVRINAMTVALKRQMDGLRKICFILEWKPLLKGA